MDQMPEMMSSELYEKAKELGIDRVTLAFSGGDDEGNLQVYTIVSDKHKLKPYMEDYNKRQKLKGKTKEAFEAYQKQLNEFADAVENWAWTVYEYSGTGDGTAYGDDITYLIGSKKIIAQEWFHEAQYLPKTDFTWDGKLIPRKKSLQTKKVKAKKAT